MSIVLAIGCCGCNEQNNVERSAGNIESYMKEVVIGQAEIAANIHSTQNEETCENDVSEVDENVYDEEIYRI